MCHPPQKMQLGASGAHGLANQTLPNVPSSPKNATGCLWSTARYRHAGHKAQLQPSLKNKEIRLWSTQGPLARKREEHAAVLLMMTDKSDMRCTDKRRLHRKRVGQTMIRLSCAPRRTHTREACQPRTFG